MVRLNALAAIPLIKKLFAKDSEAPAQAQSKMDLLPMQPMMLLGGNTQVQTPTLHLEVRLKKANGQEEIIFTQGFSTTENWRNFTQVIDIPKDKLADCEEGELILKWHSLPQQNSTPTVWVDEVKVERSSLEVMTWADYYPYGLVMGEGTCDSYRYQYQGETAEKDKETGWNHFELREYESVIGRWLSKDPKNQYHSVYVGMGNNPVSGIDPDGGETLDDYYIDVVKGTVKVIKNDNPIDNFFINSANSPDYFKYQFSTIKGRWGDFNMVKLPNEDIWRYSLRGEKFTAAPGYAAPDLTIESIVIPFAPKGGALLKNMVAKSEELGGKLFLTATFGLNRWLNKNVVPQLVFATEKFLINERTLKPLVKLRLLRQETVDKLLDNLTNKLTKSLTSPVPNKLHLKAHEAAKGEPDWTKFLDF